MAQHQEAAQKLAERMEKCLPFRFAYECVPGQPKECTVWYQTCLVTRGNNILLTTGSEAKETEKSAASMLVSSFASSISEGMN